MGMEQVIPPVTKLSGTFVRRHIADCPDTLWRGVAHRVDLMDSARSPIVCCEPVVATGSAVRRASPRSAAPGGTYPADRGAASRSRLGCTGCLVRRGRAGVRPPTQPVRAGRRAALEPPGARRARRGCPGRLVLAGDGL